jgi:hypothetical protein
MTRLRRVDVWRSWSPLSFLVMGVGPTVVVFPLHSWVLRAFDKGSLFPVALLFNSLLEALLNSR